MKTAGWPLISVALSFGRIETMQINIQPDIRAVTKWLTALEKKQLPYATAVALTKTAGTKKSAKGSVKTVLQREMVRRLDRPTPFTVNSGLYTIPANKRRFPITSVVGIKGRQWKYMRYQVQGGTRTGRGILVPVNVRLNKYGNIPRGSLRRAMGRSDTFRAKINGVNGFWQRKKNGRLKLLAAYRPSARYKKRFDFYRIANRAARKLFPIHFNREMRNAIRTAR